MFQPRVTVAAIGGAIAGTVLVVARRTIIDWPTITLAAIPAIVLFNFKKLSEPHVIVMAAIIGLILQAWL